MCTSMTTPIALLLLHFIFPATTLAPPTPQSIVLPLSNGVFNPTPKRDSFYNMVTTDLKCGIKKGTVSKTSTEGESVDIYTPCVIYPNQVLYSSKPTIIASSCPLLKCTNLSPTGNYALNGVKDVPDYAATVKAKKLVRTKPEVPLYDAEINYICDQFTFDNISTQLAISHSEICQVASNDEFVIRSRYEFEDWGVNRLRSHFHGPWTDSDKDLRAQYGILDNKFTMADHVFLQCDASCDKGSVLKFTMKKDFAWTLEFFLAVDTPAVKICFNTSAHAETDKLPVCHPDLTMTILPQNNLVLWPFNRMASYLRFGNKPIESTPTGKPILLHFQLIGRHYGGNQIGVQNRFNELVLSDSSGYQSEHLRLITVFLPKEDTLHSGFGIYPVNLESATTLVKKGETVKRRTAAGVANEKISEKYGEIIKALTSPKPTVPVPKSTTPPPQIVYVKDSISEEPRDYASQYTKGKWLLFAVLLGFIIGTLIITIIGGAIMYLLRRTVYSFWYRGMFKRYGCDASGTTGGLTGIGFGTQITTTQTIGGKTTVGATSGSTTGGGTTAALTTGDGTSMAL
ncbi:unnamed protein product [Caenorhabditis bovis]|uniref:Glycoprotein n=1 Tax=Caenorhabditis bovis TaxID=2654633 RepID=A0A8S1EYA5_9PELO|nr:unnamed protein product [Caenorhabditis bovis]